MRFRGEKHLVWWLTESVDGRALLASLPPEHQSPTVGVLAVSHADHIELFAPRHVRVKEITAVHCPGVKGELLSEQLVELELPPGWRRLFEPYYRRAILMQQKITPEQKAWQKWMLQLIKQGGKRA